MAAGMEPMGIQCLVGVFVLVTVTRGAIIRAGGGPIVGLRGAAEPPPCGPTTSWSPYPTSSTTWPTTWSTTWSTFSPSFSWSYPSTTPCPSTVAAIVTKIPRPTPLPKPQPPLLPLAEEDSGESDSNGTMRGDLESTSQDSEQSAGGNGTMLGDMETSQNMWQSNNGNGTALGDLEATLQELEQTNVTLSGGGNDLSALAGVTGLSALALSSLCLFL